MLDIDVGPWDLFSPVYVIHVHCIDFPVDLGKILKGLNSDND